MKYNYTKGLYGNIEELFKGLTKTSNQTINNKAQYDVEHLQDQANMVQAVVDEYNALCE